jgi:hypothetical protein
MRKGGIWGEEGGHGRDGWRGDRLRSREGCKDSTYVPHLRCRLFSSEGLTACYSRTLGPIYLPQY